MQALLLLAMLSGSGDAAVSPFTGDWVMEPPPSPPMKLSLGKGVFSRGKGASSVRVDADGHFHRLPPDDYVDEVAVVVLGPGRLREIDRLHGRVVYVVAYTVSAGGRALTQRVTEYTRPDHRPVTATVTYRRNAGAGSRLTGLWTSVGVQTSRANLTDRFEVSGDRFSRSSLGGYGYDAMIGGPPVPVRGDAPGARMQVSMPDARTIVERLSLNGALGVVSTMSLQPDGRTIRVTGERVAGHSQFSWVMRKQ